MAAVAFLISLAIAGIGLVGVFSPARLLSIVARVQTPGGVWFAAAFRLLYGAALCLAAPASGSPQAIGGLGVFVIIAGLVTPVFGLERYRRLLGWWSSRGETFVRAWAAFAALFGLAIASLLRP